MNLNRDAGAERLPSHTGLRPARRPTQPTVAGEVVVNMPRVNPAVAAVPPRQTIVSGQRAAENLDAQRGLACAGIGVGHA